MPCAFSMIAYALCRILPGLVVGMIAYHYVAALWTQLAIATHILALP